LLRFPCKHAPDRRSVNKKEVVLVLRRAIHMASATTSSRGTLYATDSAVRILRWTFRRDEDTVVCELGLNRDNSAYELRVDPPWNPTGVSNELFDDAVSAFHRHAALERILVTEGWRLEAFESNQSRAEPVLAAQPVERPVIERCRVAARR
jgi:hypothetical protein